MTRGELLALRWEASVHGDLVQCAICDIALTGTYDPTYYNFTDGRVVARLDDYTKANAIGECERVHQAARGAAK